MKAIKIEVSGKVQGVGYRAAALAKALELSIAGIVKNMDDGSVQILAEGETEALVHFQNWCQRGPFFARVKSIQTEETELKHYSAFVIEK